MGHSQVSLPLAHAGHWSVWVLYAVPVVVVLAAVLGALIHQRRDRAATNRSPRP